MVSFGVVMSAIAIGIGFYKLFGNSEIKETLFIATSDENRPLSNNIWLRLGVMAFLTLVVVGAIFVRLQVYPVTSPYAASYTGRRASYLMDMAVGPNEDFTFSLMLTNILVTIIWFIVWLTFKYDIKENIAIFLVVIFVASMLSSFGFVNIIPSFSEAHKKAYQECQPCYYSAGIFNLIISIGQQLTGLFFLGIPHAAHNLAYDVGCERGWIENCYN